LHNPSPSFSFFHPSPPHFSLRHFCLSLLLPKRPPLNPARWSGERRKLPQRVRAVPDHQTACGAFWAKKRVLLVIATYKILRCAFSQKLIIFLHILPRNTSFARVWTPGPLQNWRLWLSPDQHHKTLHGAQNSKCMLNAITEKRTARNIEQKIKQSYTSKFPTSPVSSAQLRTWGLITRKSYDYLTMW